MLLPCRRSLNWIASCCGRRGRTAHAQYQPSPDWSDARSLQCRAKHISNCWTSSTRVWHSSRFTEIDNRCTLVKKKKKKVSHLFSFELIENDNISTSALQFLCMNTYYMMNTSAFLVFRDEHLWRVLCEVADCRLS